MIAETNAVNSENNKNFESDSWRYYQLFYELAQQGSAFNRFIIGNSETLNKDGIRQELIEFYNKWYSSNIMKICMYSNKPLDELESMLRAKFSLIENKNIEKPSYSIPENYPSSYLGKLVKMESIKDINELNIIWILKNYEKDTDYPLNYITHVLAHQGKVHI